jgi:hypothetical protein
MVKPIKFSNQINYPPLTTPTYYTPVGVLDGDDAHGLTVRIQITNQNPDVSIHFSPVSFLSPPPTDIQDITSLNTYFSDSISAVMQQHSSRLNRLVNQPVKPEVINLSFGYGPGVMSEQVLRILNAKGSDGRYQYPTIRHQILGTNQSLPESDVEDAVWQYLKHLLQSPEFRKVEQAQDVWRESLATADAKGVTIVRSAGNNGGAVINLRLPPADRQLFNSDFYNARPMILVGSVDANHRPVISSSLGDGNPDNGTSPLVAMQGTDVPIYPGALRRDPTLHDHLSLGGTSYAAPKVVGVISRMEAIAREHGVDLTPNDVKNLLKRSTVSANATSSEDTFARVGFGVLSPEKAYQETRQWLDRRSANNRATASQSMENGTDLTPNDMKNPPKRGAISANTTSFDGSFARGGFGILNPEKAHPKTATAFADPGGRRLDHRRRGDAVDRQETGGVGFSRQP